MISTRDFEVSIFIPFNLIHWTLEKPLKRLKKTYEKDSKTENLLIL